MEVLREQARRSFGGRIDQMGLSRERLRAKEADYASADRFREYGDIIMANSDRIGAGDEWLEAENFYAGGFVRIRLDSGKKGPVSCSGAGTGSSWSAETRRKTTHCSGAIVKGRDLWLHVRDYPGSYVFVKHRAGKAVPPDILLDTGNLALFYSKARNNGEADLFYTQVQFLRRAKNDPQRTGDPHPRKKPAHTSRSAAAAGTGKVPSVNTRRKSGSGSTAPQSMFDPRRVDRKIEEIEYVFFLIRLRGKLTGCS
jgi:predicted ribosome quality control (RQC) complex YloA/Tae2 family protein